MKATFASYKNKVVNKLNDNFAESNLVYPIDKGYHQVAQLDKSWVQKQLRFLHLTQRVTGISNKYVVRIKNDMLVYNCDDKYWLIKK
jgi:hypothetical protein